jgi:hypothetical protein
MSSSSLPKIAIEPNPSNDEGSSSSTTGNTLETTSYHNNSEQHSYSTLSSPTNHVGSHDSLPPLTSTSSPSSYWYVHQSVTAQQYPQTPNVEHQSQEGVDTQWVSPPVAPQNSPVYSSQTPRQIDQWHATNEFYHDAQPRPTQQWNTASAPNYPSYNPSYSPRNGESNSTNTTSSLTSARMSHLINAVEFAVNNVATRFDPNRYYPGYDGVSPGTSTASTNPNWSDERRMGFRGYYDNPQHYGYQQNGVPHNLPQRNHVSYRCPTCKRVYNWKYNLTRHMRYECGTESRFQCAHCNRCFPHKQNAIHHNMRKHRIRHDKNHHYVEKGDIIIKSVH